MIITTESLCVLVLTTILNTTIEIVNDNIWLNIVLSIIPRCLQVLLLSFCIYKRNVGRMVNYIELILKNKVLSISMSVFFITVIISNVILQRFIIGMNYLNHYIMIIKVSLTVLIVIIPLIMIGSYIVSVCNLMWINIKTQKEKENMLNDAY